MIERAFEENVRSQVARLTHFSALLERMFERTIGYHDGSIHLTLLFASILKVRQSARAVHLLAEAGCVEEILAIGRTLLEVTVNAGYLQVANGRETERYLQFHPEAPNQYAPNPYGMVRQSVSRSLGSLSSLSSLSSLGSQIARRLSAISLLRLSPAPRREPNAAWSAHTLTERASISDETSEIPVMALLVQRCFTRGLAAVQGTIGSLDCFVSAIANMEPPRLEGRLAELTEALFGINLCLLTLCLYLNSYFQLHMDLEIDGASHDHASEQDEAGERRWA